MIGHFFTHSLSSQEKLQEMKPENNNDKRRSFEEEKRNDEIKKQKLNSFGWQLDSDSDSDELAKINILENNNNNNLAIRNYEIKSRFNSYLLPDLGQEDLGKDLEQDHHHHHHHQKQDDLECENHQEKSRSAPKPSPNNHHDYTKIPPLGFLKAFASDGTPLYFPKRTSTTTTTTKTTNQATATNNLLLGERISTLMDRVQEEMRLNRALALNNQRLEKESSGHKQQKKKGLDNDDDDDDGIEKSPRDAKELWVQKYAPKHYVNLAGDEVGSLRYHSL
jgi:hypothetical protein